MPFVPYGKVAVLVEDGSLVSTTAQPVRITGTVKVLVSDVLVVYVVEYISEIVMPVVIGSLAASL
jgi:hypothetical protein